ncbi:MAG: glycoside hydrolase family 3 C-terminal domain-containing protein [Butyribacter sp.]|nr:glycoside hydrolase family 3 C-terminal domain-containing protein [bacterium]MDY3854890.1 glycoside hydrolase family 3 C-terminal domain-containing protein [Butyribacter sp.]
MKKYLETPLWDNNKSEDERLDYLLSELTLEEKFQCLGTGNIEIPRLGIPAFGVGGEGAHGIQARKDQSYDLGTPVPTTILPNPIGMSATWDEELIKKAGAMVGTEARGLYHTGKHGSLCLWAPTVDMERDPRWGRTEEGYGEDPYLTGKMAGAYTEGIQGDDARYLRCGATLKHFYANNAEEGRTYVSSSIDLRNKYEYYLEPFRRLAQEHHAEGVMTAYNEVNGVPAILLKEDIAQLKEWGIGHVVCDGGDFGQTVDFHKYFSRHSETIAASLDAHVDCLTDDKEMIEEAAREAYEHKMISEKQIDAALKNYFRVLLRLGFFDKDGENPYRNIGLQDVGTEENHNLARKVTQESVVLLKNEEILPLNPEKFGTGKEKLAVIGPVSDVWFKDWYSGIPPYYVTPAQGIRNVVEDGILEEEGVSYIKIRICENVGGESDCRENACCAGVGDNNDCRDNLYLGLLGDGRTIGCVPEEKAETFRVDDWGDGKVTLRATGNGKLLTTQDDSENGEDGSVAATKEEAFGWFVKEIFYYQDGRLLSWDKQPMEIDGNGVLKKITESKYAQTEKNQGKQNAENEHMQTEKNQGILSAESEHMQTEKNQGIQVELVIQKDGLAAAEKTAKEADKVVLFLGANPMITCKEEIDRTHLDLPSYQEEMLRRVSRANKNVVLVLVSSVPFAISYAKENIAGIMQCATGSMELGNGIADVLFGKTSPSGKLNMTWYQSAEDLPPIEDYDIIQGKRTYQYYQGEVLYPFGYGLNYGRTKCKNLRLLCVDDKKISIETDVCNDGEITTDEVVQIYAGKADSEISRATKKLVGFRRVKALAPHETRTVSFEVLLDDLQYFDVISEKMLLEPGTYQIMAGRSSEMIDACMDVTVDGTRRPRRNGRKRSKAECYDRACNYVLRPGHLGYTAVCTKNGTDVLELHYDKMYFEKAPQKLVLDFWKEYECSIRVEVDGKEIAAYELESPNQGESKMLEAGQANGDGAFQAHQNWLTKDREKGFAEIVLPVREIPVGEEFTLTIKWQGKGKLCTYHFE